MTEIEETIKSLKEMFPKGLCEADEYKMAQMAINALEKQKKIKDLLDSCTAYPDDMCDCLVEIEKILRSEEE